MVFGNGVISPVASNITGSTAEDTDFSGSLSGSDADGDFNLCNC